MFENLEPGSQTKDNPNNSLKTNTHITNKSKFLELFSIIEKDIKLMIVNEDTIALMQSFNYLKYIFERHSISSYIEKFNDEFLTIKFNIKGNILNLLSIKVLKASLNLFNFGINEYYSTLVYMEYLTSKILDADKKNYNDDIVEAERPKILPNTLQYTIILKSIKDILSEIDAIDEIFAKYEYEPGRIIDKDSLFNRIDVEKLKRDKLYLINELKNKASSL